MEGSDLLLQLELILEHDDLIDEIGFLHPTQFASLNADQHSSSLNSNEKFFWNKDHKLAISAEILPRLYKAAVHAHSNARKSYKATINSTLNGQSPDNGNSSLNLDSCELFEKELLRHSKVLVILSPNFPTAWNSRKLLLSKQSKLSLFENELKLSTLVLSYSPKSECAWSHRRWVIKNVEQNFQNLQEITCNESELVKAICEKYKMNYRAWNHRCWLVSYMSIPQVLDELNKSRKWAELHVADSSCFHFRTCLLLRMIQDSSVKQIGDNSSSDNLDVSFLLEDELKWNESLINRYTGREALWIHRRFLSHCWINHFLANQNNSPNLEDFHQINSPLDLFLDREIQIVITCLNAPADEFDETQVQARLAASYILWIAKQVPVVGSKVHERLSELGDINAELIKICPEKTWFWLSLLNC